MKLLHRSGAGISYDDVTKQIKSFSTEIQNNVNLAPKNISKGQPTYITINNSDGRKQTLTGLDTTQMQQFITKKMKKLQQKRKKKLMKIRNRAPLQEEEA